MLKLIKKKKKEYNFFLMEAAFINIFKIKPKSWSVQKGWAKIYLFKSTPSK